MASKIEVKDLLEAGVHFGHLTRKWNPNMAPYIYMERNGIHVINLYKTVAKLEEANEALKKIASSGRKILFVATKKQAKDIVADKVSKVNMPYITERWPGGMLTNFVTIRKAVKKMASIDRMKKDGTFNTLSKKERLQVDRLRAKLEKNLGSIADMTRLPGAIFIVDTMREHIAVKEAQKLNIPIFAMVDTNSDPRDIDYAIPSNDDAGKSIEIILEEVTKAVAEGLEERKSEKSNGKEEEKEAPKAENAPKKGTKADDLTKIEGIGPKAAEALVESGIVSFSDLAKADTEDIKSVLTEASSTLAHLDPTSWPKQAKMAADGEWDELKEWQDKVKGGVE
ncbi:30S ribosomal protein S2 [Flagellimonas zhangzhouensis]|uniref:Small ribosomal subunit protein uS2 n=1 Tax=Flagellimonas zhangzhouensis TaxID=1073328 RepID=A0A1H2WVT6_9FLAO|nr:30S ribosomal protein S2 [Allomuricauda zhangzhouensis]SDQ25283.1 SSU ribosomal protein S2P [Allomuricauda zhangzhouensis]SDW84618.1 small subunit ribosomal protein S2 [Allomuricauda zhangzhouensis]